MIPTILPTHGYNFVPLCFPKIVKEQPIHGARLAFTDGAKGGTGAVMIDNQIFPVAIATSSPQAAELAAVALTLKLVPGCLNILSDSLYVVNAVKRLEMVEYIAPRSMVHTALSQVRQLLMTRSNPLYVGFIRAHSNLPGPLTRGNAIADFASRFLLAFSVEDEAKCFHQRWHVSAQTLTKRFSISRKAARDIVRHCQACVPFLSQPSVGVNPRGLLPKHIWQMDVTHVPSFGCLSFVHVSIDTCSGVLFASAHTGEKVRDVISHCLQAFAAWGVPQCYKTDNGPAYAAKAFATFCTEFGIKHSTGIPYNPTGQAVVERAHSVLKTLLIKQKGGIGASLYPSSPKHQLALVTYIFNFLILDLDGCSAAERHATGPGYCKDLIMWKDVLTKQWKGPHPVLRRT